MSHSRERIATSDAPKIDDGVKVRRPVCEALLDELGVVVGVLTFAINFQTEQHLLSLFLGQEFGILGKTDHSPKSKEADNNSGNPFNDEDPSPADQTINSIHFQDSIRKNTTEGT
jgi:hypothetical protein